MDGAGVPEGAAGRGRSNRRLAMTRYGTPLLRSAILALCLASAPALAADGPLSNATVSFGGWMTSPPLDRFPNNSDRFANHHELTPNEVTIKAGGTVNRTEERRVGKECVSKCRSRGRQ